MEVPEYEAMFRVEETHWWYRSLHRLIFETLEREMPRWRQMRVLDAGCGTGAILKRLGRPEQNVGVDLAPEAIAFCRWRGLTNTQLGDICDLPFADDSFDIVICSSVLYHQWVKDIGKAVREFNRVLRPDGLFLVNLPAFQFLHSTHDVAVMTARRFVRSEVRSLLLDNGFGIRRLTYWTTLLFPLALAARTFGGSSSGRDFETTGFTNRVLSGVMWAEGKFLRTMSLPFGVALFAVGRKQGSSTR